MNLKGRIDRGDMGLVDLCRVRRALNVWADVQYGKSVRPLIFEKLSDPERFDLHSPCEKELQLDRAHTTHTSIVTLNQLDISNVEQTFIDFKCELHGSMLDGDIKATMKKDKAYHDTCNWISKSADALCNLKLEFANSA